MKFSILISFFSLYSVSLFSQFHSEIFENAFFKSQFYLDSLNGFIVGGVPENNLLKTYDGGCSWSTINTNIFDSFSDIYFTNDSTGYIAGTEFVYKTIDGGETWVQLTNSFCDNCSFKSIYFPIDSIGYVIGRRNTILKTIDSGSSWEAIFEQNTDTIFHSQTWINQSIGFILSSYTTTTLYKTTDSGSSWDSLPIIPSGIYFKSQFLNSEVGYVGGYNNSFTGKLLKTINGGSDWETLNYGSNNEVKDLYFITEQYGYILLFNGSFLVTYDGGINWEGVAQFPSSSWGDIYITEDNNWHIVEAQPLIILPGVTSYSATSHYCDPTSIFEQNITDSNILIYPNPTTNYFSIQSNFQEKFNFVIYDYSGKTLQTQNNIETNQLISTTNLANGIYFVKIWNDHNSEFIVKKLILEK